MKKILIYDDEKDILEATSLVLSDQYEVHTREKVTNLIPTVEKINPDLILMDIWIPKIGGEGALKLLRQNQETEDIPVIFFSANNEIARITEESGADGYIAKPFGIDEILDYLAKVLEEKKN